MIPSAKIAIRPRPPPLNRLSNPRIELPPKFFWMALTALVLIPGAGIWVPSRYSASSAAVNRTFLRMSGTRNAPRMVAIMGSGLQDLTGPPGGLDRDLRRLAERVGVHGQRLGDLARGQHLDRDALT